MLCNLAKPFRYVITVTPDPTVLPAKSDSEVMFCIQIYQGLRIDRINTQVSYQFALAQVEWKD